MSEMRDYQVDYVLLLVGSNPLPNAVTGKLLAPTGGIISLIHSADGLSLAQRLKSWFLDAGYSDTNIVFTQVGESDATSVYQGVYTALKKYESDSDDVNRARMVRVGLNYTGGTKVMSVQAYRALEDWARSRSMDAVFSYLDAHTLQMRFDPAPGRPAISFYAGLGIDISIDELLALHNWKTVKAPIRAPVLPESAKALLSVHSNPTNAGIWTKWLRSELFQKARKRVPLPPPIWVSQAGEELQERYDVMQPAPNDRWKSKTELQKLQLSWPDLPILRETMSKELAQDSAEYLKLTAGPGPSRCKDEEDFCRWLSGTWLESAVLSALQNCPQELHLKERCMDIRPKVLGNGVWGTEFQFDVVAIRGYQLFAFSCTTESAREGGGRGLLKHKLFEAYVRARQMGGDEACAALVCCMSQEKADELEAEVCREISPEGGMRVFGRESLANLGENIADWVRQQSKEG